MRLRSIHDGLGPVPGLFELEPYQELVSDGPDEQTDPDLFRTRDSTNPQAHNGLLTYEAGIQHCLDTVMFVCRQVGVQDPELIIVKIRKYL